MASEAEKQAGLDLRKKLMLEREFRPQVNRQFGKERQAFARAARQMGEAPLALEIGDKFLAPSWAAVLLPHYLLTLEEFDASDFTGFAELTVLRQSREIAATSLKDMADSVFEARADLVAQSQKQLITTGTEFSIAILIKAALRILGRKQGARVESIVMTETQIPAEGGKQLAARRDENINKQWITVRDGKVRQSHVAAHGQRKLETDPFIVGGQQLRYPGDSMLGASTKNVINCRCAAIYE